MFYIIHLPSNSPILTQDKNNWDWHRKYIYIPSEEVLAERWVKNFYVPVEFESGSRAKLFLTRFSNKEKKEYIIVEVK